MKRPTALTSQELKRFQLPPFESGDKNFHGKVLIIAGSRQTPGAGLLAAHAAMRCGAGKLQLAVPNEIAVPMGFAMPEAMVLGIATARDGGFARRDLKGILDAASAADAIVAGPGLRGNSNSPRLVGELCGLSKRLILDAALLHALPEKSVAARNSILPSVLLPHSREMASLLNCEARDVEEDPLAAGQACASRYDALVLVKGPQSYVVSPDGRSWKYAGGAPGLGVSGSGDVLAGIVGGIAARGAEPLIALLWGVWLHGEAGRNLSKFSPIGFLAREIANEVRELLT